MKLVHIVMVVCFAAFSSRTLTGDGAGAREEGDRRDELISPAAPDCDTCDVLPNRPAPKRSHRDSMMCTDELKSSTMIYQFEGLDLDTGTVHTTFFPMEFDPDVDVFFEYNSRTPVHLRVFPTNEAKMAILRGVAFEDVNCIHAHTAIFTGLPKELDEPIKSGDTVILRTAEGGIFKMGNALEHDDVIVDFDWAELCVSCG